MQAKPESPPFSPLVEHAIELSAQWHDQTYRKGGWRPEPFEPVEHEILQVPVVAHVTAVAVTLARAGFDEVTVAAAFLHDALEDEDRSGRRFGGMRLSAAIGEHVTRLVECVTERKLDESGRIRGWRSRKEDYLARLNEAPLEAVAISLADKLHNIWSINQALTVGIDVFGSSPGRRALTAGPDEQRWFYESVRDLAKARRDDRLSSMLEQFESELRRFAELTAGG